MRKAIRPDRVWDPVLGVQMNVDVIIDGEFIVDIAPSDFTNESDELIILAGCTLMPGLINMHVHLLGGSRTAGWPDSRQYALGIRNSIGALLGGVTTVVDLNARSPLIFELVEAQQRGDFRGPRILAAGTAITTTGGHRQEIALEVDGADGMRRAVRQQIKAGADLIKIMATGGVGTATSSTSSFQMTDAELSSAVSTAHRAGRLITAHAYGTEGVTAVSKAGIDIVQHGVGIGAEAIDSMRDNRVGLVPTFSVYDYIVESDASYGMPAFTRERSRVVRDLQPGAVQAAIEGGVRLGFGTDTGMPYALLGTLEKEIRAFESIGLQPDDILRAATLTSSELLGMASQIGSIAAGKSADLTAVEGDPRVDRTAWTKVRDVWTSGRRHHTDHLRDCLM